MNLRRSLRGGKRGLAIGLTPLLALLLSGCATYIKGRWWRLLDVSVGASLGIGFHFYVSPGELVDFALGLVAIDLVGDDIGAESLLE